MFTEIVLKSVKALFCGMKQKAALFWSGGKDSAMALYKVRTMEPGLEVVCLVTTINSEFRRISMHGIREELLEKQAQETGLPLLKMEVPNVPTNENYERVLHVVLKDLKTQGIECIVFGDIFLEDLREYRLKLLALHDLEGIFPLWGLNTNTLMQDFLQTGFSTITCCLNAAVLKKEFLGQVVDERFLESLPTGIDPCGENGEFHTFCYKGPVFAKEIGFSKGDAEFRPLALDKEDDARKAGFWFIDLIPV